MRTGGEIHIAPPEKSLKIWPRLVQEAARGGVGGAEQAVP
jgi:hypothetical protein